MAHPNYFHANSNSAYRQKSRTLQPITRDRISYDEDNKFILRKYFDSLKESNNLDETNNHNWMGATCPIDPERANYANVPQNNHDDRHNIFDHYVTAHQLRTHQLHQRLPSHQMPLHNRSYSQHYTNPKCQVNEPTNYYNISNIGTIIPSRSQHQSPIQERQPSRSQYIQQQPLIKAQVPPTQLMQLCNLLGNVDCPPPMPCPRQYTIRSQDGVLYKSKMPQNRVTRDHYTDPIRNIHLSPGTPITVLCPSTADRSKFTICVNDSGIHLDIPHQLTTPIN